MKKKYDIKTTDVETLKKWYHLMTLGRALDDLQEIDNRPLFAKFVIVNISSQI